MGLLDFHSKREAGHCSEMGHPWLVSVEGDGGEEAVEVVDREKGRERREGEVRDNSEDPFDGLLTGGREKRVVEEMDVGEFRIGFLFF